MKNSEHLTPVITSTTTFRELLSILPSTDLQRSIPTIKKIREESSVIFSMPISDYWLFIHDNGYFILSRNGHATAQSISRCARPIYYESVLSGSGSKVDDSAFMDQPFYMRLFCEGVDRLTSNDDSREQKKTYTYDNIPDSVDLRDPNSDVERSFIDNETAMLEHDTLHRAYAELTERQKEVLYLCDVLNLPQKDVAARLGCSKQSVSECRQRALAQLRKHFSE